ncbi:MAG: divergent polysaccharide deacetylase family protein [Deltaproteobacteria bacterium]|nr:divergent polysaccharide deacetylase family protein [Deltaproteobacteria bacterium]
MIGVWAVGLAIALGTGYLWRSWRPVQGPATPGLPLFEEKYHKEISPPRKPEPFLSRSYPKENGLPLVAIVIDDLGYQKQLALDFIELEAPLTLSFLPQAPFAGELVRQAFQKGKETMLHLPMEPKEFPQVDPGPMALLTQMSNEEIQNILVKDLEAFPQVVFLDSRTTPYSAVFPLASQLGVKAIQRDIFLDNNIEPDAIREQMELLIRLARERGFAVACGHPYPQTMLVIKEKTAELQQKVHLVPLSGLF